MSEEQTTALIPQEKRTVMQNHLRYLESCVSMTINNDQEDENAAEARKTLKNAISDLDVDKKELTKPYKEKSGKIDGDYKIVIDQLENGVTVLDKGMGEYYTKKTNEEEARNRKLLAEAEDKRNREEAAATKELDKSEKQADEGKTLLSQKSKARAYDHLQNMQTTVAPVTEISKPKGTSYQEYYKCKVLNFKQAVSTLVNNPMLHRYLTIDEKGLEAEQKRQRGKLSLTGFQFTKGHKPRSTGKK